MKESYSGDVDPPKKKGKEARKMTEWKSKQTNGHNRLGSKMKKMNKESKKKSTVDGQSGSDCVFFLFASVSGPRRQQQQEQEVYVCR